LKYRRARHLAPPLVDAALRALPPNVVSRFADLVIAPVPLSAERLALRGYNQSELLARELSEHLNLPLAARAVRRLRDTPSQMQLPAAARRANVRGAFVGDPAEVHNRTILIVDDVATTTSTLGEVSRALREAGAASVTAFVIARAE
jgi:ComF family protein